MPAALGVWFFCCEFVIWFFGPDASGPEKEKIK